MLKEGTQKGRPREHQNLSKQNQNTNTSPKGATSAGTSGLLARSEHRGSSLKRRVHGSFTGPGSQVRLSNGEMAWKVHGSKTDHLSLQFFLQIASQPEVKDIRDPFPFSEKNKRGSFDIHLEEVTGEVGSQSCFFLSSLSRHSCLRSVRQKLLRARAPGANASAPAPNSWRSQGLKPFWKGALLQSRHLKRATSRILTK